MVGAATAAFLNCPRVNAGFVSRSGSAILTLLAFSPIHLGHNRPATCWRPSLRVHALQAPLRGGGGKLLSMSAGKGATPRWATQIDESLAKNNQPPVDRYVQLATVTEDGEPRVRTVVFRGWADAPLPGDSPALSFITDSRSDKMRQSDAAEVCWYLVEAREQFRCAPPAAQPPRPPQHAAQPRRGGLSGEGRARGRLRGRLVKIGADESDAALQRMRRDMWAAISEGARQSFAWPAPGFPRPPGADDAADFQGPAVSAEDPLEPFTLVLLLPSRVERLTLRGFPQATPTPARAPRTAYCPRAPRAQRDGARADVQTRTVWEQAASGGEWRESGVNP
jgi:pyridoxamine 5'-phosphate oxidase